MALVHELDQVEFTVTETQRTYKIPPAYRPIVFITTNSERRLPEPFLRRCVYHHIDLDESLLRDAVSAHHNAYADLDRSFIDTAIQCFMRLRKRGLHKPPATSELLVWLQVLACAVGCRPEVLNVPLRDLPYLGTLIKQRHDLEKVKSGAG